MKVEFYTTDLRTMKHFLGVEVVQSSNGIYTVNFFINLVCRNLMKNLIIHAFKLTKR